ncbi:uncharacterized protein LOC128999534 [Macrosteles quadrilineatus]|uniref:uncharacterized protein LOC128999534 n=1 Tax=Macrosteles quadrilineatus TaxID=74068 RepID=UPI0023E2C204|nr:uncharacterized protein LOC128999534 [Macrosteles quadrilineatus]
MTFFNKIFTMLESGTNESGKGALLTSVGEIMCVTLPSHLCTLMVILIGRLFYPVSHTCLEDTCIPNVCEVVNQRKVTVFVKEFTLIVTLLILVTTILSGSQISVIISLVIINSLLMFRICLRHCSTTNYIVYQIPDILKLPIHDSKRSFITCCRSIVNIMTVISILAVDFRIFPRKFSKTEKYGMSLMDVGVGFFILCNAAVLKLENIVNQGFGQCFVGSLVLFIIGVLRCVFVKEIDYGVNVSEYGVYWNFFITLGVVRLLTFIVLYVFKTNSSLASVFVCLLHHCILTFGAEAYVLGDKPRENLIDANREGLVSTLGYTGLYLIGVSLNKFIVQTCTYIKGDLKSIAKLLMLSLVLFAVSSYLSPYYPPCRRVVNITYITWVLAMAAAHVAMASCVELFVICFVLPSSVNEKFYTFLTPLIYEAVNMNGLFFFLLGNILTGLVNIFCNTKKLNSLQSIFILFAYMFVNCCTVTIMYFRKITFRFW